MIIKNKLKNILVHFADYSSLLEIYSFLRIQIKKPHIAIIMYHRVCPREKNHIFNSISPERFEGHIKYLCKNFKVISLIRLVEDLKSGNSLPKKCAVVTFDDGYKDNFIYSYPILKKYGIPATIFLSTGFINTSNIFWWDRLQYIHNETPYFHVILKELEKHFSLNLGHGNDFEASIMRLSDLPDNSLIDIINRQIEEYRIEFPSKFVKDQYLSWNEIIRMHQDGIIFGAHSVNHIKLTNLALNHAKNEIVKSKWDIEKHLRIPVRLFSYPYGKYDYKIEKLLKENGFICAVTAVPKLVGKKSNLFRLGRIDCSKENFNEIKFHLSGLRGDLIF